MLDLTGSVVFRDMKRKFEYIQSCLCAPNAFRLSLCFHRTSPSSDFYPIKKVNAFQLREKICFPSVQIPLVGRAIFYGYVTVVCLSHLIFEEINCLNRDIEIINLASPRLSALSLIRHVSRLTSTQISRFL